MPLIQGTHIGRVAIVAVAITDPANSKDHKSSSQRISQGAVPFEAGDTTYKPPRLFREKR
jgi:hypothetical protein